MAYAQRRRAFLDARRREGEIRQRRWPLLPVLPTFEYRWQGTRTPSPESTPSQSSVAREKGGTGDEGPTEEGESILRGANVVVA